MAAIDFPNNPTNNQTFTSGSTTWKYDGSKWKVVTSPSNLSSTTPDALTPDQTGAAGTSSDAARADHAHEILAATASTITGTNAEGSSSSFSRADHDHKVQLSGCRLYRTSSQTGIATSTTTAIEFTHERYDVGGLHSTSSNTSRITIDKAGVWLVGGGVRWDSNSTGLRDLMIRVNGSTIIAFEAWQATATNGYLGITTVTTAYEFAVNDYVELTVWQNSGANRQIDVVGNYTPEFWAQCLTTT